MAPTPTGETKDKLLTLAQILLEDDFPRFRSALALLETDPEGFKKSEYFHNVSVYEEELFNPDFSPGRPYTTLFLMLRYAEVNRYSLWLDWTGEENEGSFELWVAERVHAFGLGSLDLTFVDDWQEQLDWDQIERGDFIREKFTLLGEHLVPLGLDLIFLNTGEDAYHPFVVRREDLARLPAFDEADEERLGGMFRIQRWDDPAL